MWARFFNSSWTSLLRPSLHRAFRSMSTIRESLVKAGVVSDVIDQPTDTQINVTYGDREVKPGDILTPTLVSKRPSVSIPSAKQDGLYSLLITDPDAPSRQDPKWGEWRHWLVVNIPGSDFTGGNVSSGDEVVEYIGSGPPEKTGLHRYIFLAFEQQGQVNYTDERLIATTENRANTKARDLISKYNLGQPIAANFFLAEYDDFVPQLYKMLEENLQKKKASQ